MSRFGEPPDPLFQRINSSIGFDWRLGPYDVDQSRAHAKALNKLGVLDDDELKQIDAGLESVGEELAGGQFAYSPGDEDIHMAIERRLTEIVGPLGGKLHTARSRNDQVATDLAMFVRGHAQRAGDLLADLLEVLADLAERPTRTGRRPPTRTCSAPSPSTSGTTCSPTSGCSSATPAASSS